MQSSYQFRIKIIHPSLTLKGKMQAARHNGLGKSEAVIAIQRKKRIAKLDVRSAVALTQHRQLVNNRLNGSLAIGSSDPMGTIGTMLRTTPARIHRKGARQSGLVMSRIAKALSLYQVPPREWQRIEIIYRRTF